MTTTNNQCKGAAEVTYDTSTGTSSYANFSAPLAQNPAIIIFDNQSSVTVAVSDDGTNTFKTFTAGQALSLDLRTNKGEHADDFTWPIGTQFQANCSAGTGLFRISYVFAK